MMSNKLSHKIQFTLTVAESKRLIALGLKKYAPVVSRLQHGIVLITKGTTNTYVAKELTDLSLASGDFVNGHILPSKTIKHLEKQKAISEIVLKKGQLLEDSFPEILEMMKPGDVIFKGANIINYAKRQAGVVIMHPKGGTCHLIEPAIEKHQLHLIIPVGLEKDSSGDIDILSEQSKELKVNADGNAPWIWSLRGDIFTEIEAIKQFANVAVIPIAKGGIAGAEGAVTLIVSGAKEEVDIISKIVDTIQGEVDYVE